MAFYIGAALLAFVTLSLVSVYLLASQELQNYTATKHGTLGREAARQLAAGGRPALERWLREEAPIPADVTVYVLDSASRDILGRAVPDFYRSVIERYVTAPPGSTEPNYRPVRLAPQLVASNGESYAFMVLPNRIGLLGNTATTLGLLAVAALVIATIAWGIARAIGRPVGELQTVVRELASGRVAARAPLSLTARRDELGALAVDFNQMAEQIAALLASRQRLTSEMSHELRSPLARLQAALALAAHRGSMAEADLARIEREIGRMDQVITDLLRYSRLDAAAPMQQRLTRLDALLGQIVHDEEIEASAHGNRLALDCQRDLLVIGDPELLRSGFENLLRNAIRYAPPGTAVEVTAKVGASGHQILIEDRGPGVPEAMLEKIFEPYVRVADQTTGTGLGLAIARRVFAAHGGSICASPRIGGGLRVAVELPAAQLE